MTSLIVAALLSMGPNSGRSPEAPAPPSSPTSAKQAPSGSVQAPTGSEPAPSPPVTPVPADKARAEYERKFIDISDQPTLACDDQACAQTVIAVPTQGMTFRRALEPAEFYRTVGRDDLAVRYESAAFNRHLVAGLGTVAGLGMMLVATVWVSEHQPQGINCDPTTSLGQFQTCAQDSQAQFQRQSDQNLDVLLMTGMGAAAVLIGSWLYAATDANPVSLEERRQLARDYDKKLATQLGVPVSETEELPPRPGAPHLTLAPRASRNGGGVSLVATF